MPALRKQRLGGLVQHRPEHGVAGLGDVAIIVDLAGLVASRCQTNVRADRPRVNKALRLIDRRPIGESHDRPDARRGHQPPAHGILANQFEQHFVLHNGWDKNDPKDAQVILHMLRIGATQAYVDPLAAGINDLQELSKTHETISKAKTQT